MGSAVEVMMEFFTLTMKVIDVNARTKMEGTTVPKKALMDDVGWVTVNTEKKVDQYEKNGKQPSSFSTWPRIARASLTIQLFIKHRGP